MVTVPHGRGRALLGALSGSLKGKPVQIGYLFNPEQRRLVAELLDAETYDVAYAYYIRSAEALVPAYQRAKATFLALQLSQTLNTERLAKTAHKPWERAFYAHESRRMGAYEAKVWQRPSRVVLIGKKDVAAIEAACRRHDQPSIDNVVMGPHGVDTEQFKPADPADVEPRSVVMSGVMRYAPNVEAASWFAKGVWPKVRAQASDARFYIVGRDPVPALLALDGKDGITVTGTVDDPATWIGKAHVAVAPDPGRGRFAEQAARSDGDGKARGRDLGGERGDRRRARPRPPHRRYKGRNREVYSRPVQRSRPVPRVGRKRAGLH